MYIATTDVDSVLSQGQIFWCNDGMYFVLFSVDKGSVTFWSRFCRENN